MRSSHASAAAEASPIICVSSTNPIPNRGDHVALQEAEAGRRSPASSRTASRGLRGFPWLLPRLQPPGGPPKPADPRRFPSRDAVPVPCPLSLVPYLFGCLNRCSLLSYEGTADTGPRSIPLKTSRSPFPPG